jgi:uncharacterized protein (TIGR02217 family)
MSGFHEVRFPDNIAYGATGGPEFATTVVATGSGHEKRNADWSEALGRWEVASGLKKQAQIDELIAFLPGAEGPRLRLPVQGLDRPQGRRTAAGDRRCPDPVQTRQALPRPGA